jgi:hypothetical protein
LPLWPSKFVGKVLSSIGRFGHQLTQALQNLDLEPSLATHPENRADSNPGAALLCQDQNFFEEKVNKKPCAAIVARA